MIISSVQIEIGRCAIGLIGVRVDLHIVVNCDNWVKGISVLLGFLGGWRWEESFGILS